MSLVRQIQKIIEEYPKEVNLVHATIQSLSPITLVVKGQEKIRPSGNNRITIAQHLTDYAIPCKLELPKFEGDFVLSVPGHLAPAKSTFQQGKLTEENGTITLKNHLKVGDSVVAISYAQGQRYFIIDREG